MAEQKKKPQAGKSAPAKKTDNKQKSGAKKPSVSINAGPVDHKVPVRLISSIMFLGLFILLLVVFFKPEGAFVKLVEGIIKGLVGKVGFVLCIPGFLYLFIIQPAGSVQLPCGPYALVHLLLSVVV